MSLSDWERNGWLTKHQTSRNEIRDLLQVVERDLVDSAAEGLSADWRMNIAYNAGLQAATVALAAAGYRASRDAHHYRVIQSLRETTCAAASDVATFDAFRKKRNVTGYERVGLVSDADADAMRALEGEVAGRYRRLVKGASRSAVEKMSHALITTISRSRPRYGTD